MTDIPVCSKTSNSPSLEQLRVTSTPRNPSLSGTALEGCPFFSASRHSRHIAQPFALDCLISSNVAYKCFPSQSFPPGIVGLDAWLERNTSRGISWQFWQSISLRYIYNRIISGGWRYLIEATAGRPGTARPGRLGSSGLWFLLPAWSRSRQTGATCVFLFSCAAEIRSLALTEPSSGVMTEEPREGPIRGAFYGRMSR